MLKRWTIFEGLLDTEIHAQKKTRFGSRNSWFQFNTRSNQTTSSEEEVPIDGTNAPQYLCLWVIHIPNIRPQDLKSQPRWHAYASTFRLDETTTLGHNRWGFDSNPLISLHWIGITKYPEHILIRLKPLGEYKIAHIVHRRLLSSKHWVLICWV